jgi:ABC-type glycerol-3-phosphate transport system substrate-binding protein
MGGNIFENGKAVINSEKCVSALTNYAESFQFAHPDSPQFWWDEQVEVFGRGDAAMMMLFSDHATPLEDRSVSSVVGKVGYTLVPGKASVLGGWSIGVNPFSEKKNDAFEFAKWTATESLIIPNAMLGRIVPYRSVFESAELHNMYPWYRILPNAFSSTRRRAMPKNMKGEGVSEAVLEQIIGNAVHKTLEKRLSAQEALREAAQQLTNAIK